MSRWLAAFVVGVSAAVVSCATVKPASLCELQELTSDSRATTAKSESPVSWEEGLRYLSAADEAYKRGKADQSDRMAELGIVQIKIALAGAVQAEARKRLEAAIENKKSIAEEIERIQAEIDKLEAERERRAIRKHLESVVDATRLRAAAAEELWTGKLSGEDKRRLEDARRKIGRQMMSRIDVWREVLSSLISSGVIPKEKIALVDEEIQAADRELGKLDLASMQEHIERAGAEVRRLINEAWEGREEERATKSKKLSALLSKSKFEIVEEEFGQVILIEAPLSKSKKVGKRAIDNMKNLGAALKDAEPINLLIATSVEGANENKTDLQSQKLAQEATEAISDGGFPPANIVERACGSNTPIQAQKGVKNSVAVVLIPLP